MEDTSTLTNQFSLVLGSIAVMVLGFLADKLKNYLQARRNRKKENPVYIAKKDAAIDELLLEIRNDLKSDSAMLWQKDRPEKDQVRYSVTHEKPKQSIKTFREESQNVLQYDINHVFLQMREQGVVQVQIEQLQEQEKRNDGKVDWKLTGLMTHRELHDVVMAYVCRKDEVLGFIWLSYHINNIQEISPSERERLKEYARRMAYLISEL